MNRNTRNISIYIQIVSKCSDRILEEIEYIIRIENCIATHDWKRQGKSGSRGRRLERTQESDKLGTIIGHHEYKCRTRLIQLLTLQQMLEVCQSNAKHT